MTDQIHLAMFLSISEEPEIFLFLIKKNEGERWGMYWWRNISQTTCIMRVNLSHHDTFFMTHFMLILSCKLVENNYTELIGRKRESEREGVRECMRHRVCVCLCVWEREKGRFYPRRSVSQPLWSFLQHRGAYLQGDGFPSASQDKSCTLCDEI